MIRALIHSFSLLSLLLGASITSIAQGNQGESIDQLIEEGRRFYFRQEYTKAIERYQKGLELAPQNVTALYELAWAYFELSEYPSSLEAATGAPFSNSEEMDRLYALISLNYYYTMTVATYEVELNERTDEEVAQFREMALTAEDGDERLFKLGLTYRTRNDPDQAITIYSEAVRLRPDYMEAHWDLGKCLDGKGRYSFAAMAYSHAILSNPEGVFTDRILTMLENSLLRLSADSGSVRTTPGGDAADLAKHLKEIVSSRDVSSQEDTPLGQHYVPWYRELIAKGHLETFANYLYQAAGDPNADKWIVANPDRIRGFLEWAGQYHWNGAIVRTMEE